MAKLKVLFICHNHPSVRPGGAEGYALELYKALRESDEFEPIFLAKGGPPVSLTRPPHAGTQLGMVGEDPNQYFFYTDGFNFDWLNGTARNKDIYNIFLRDFLAAIRPDVVHIQHTLFFGYDLLREIRNTLGDIPIVYTLHEFLPICHRDGQMVRTSNVELCSEESPHRCHECFPEISPQSFYMRKRFIMSHLTEVDLFLAPSHFLLERYVAWGIPREKIQFEDYGRLPVASLAEMPDDRPRNHLGFFGQLSLFKGVNVLLKAMEILGREPAEKGPIMPLRRPDPGGMSPRSNAPHLWVHGANLELQQGTFQNEFRSLIDATKQNVSLVGRYGPEDLPGLMAHIDWVVVPSIWWENAPLVIQEAFAYGRPVICSDVGGMAEKVTHGVNGLHFRVGNPLSLAETIRGAVSEPGLWQSFRTGIPQVYPMKDHVPSLTEIYRGLIESTTVGR